MSRPHIAYDLRGPQGRTPLVFLHGASASRTDWDDVVPAFDDRPVLAVDQRGHGDSEHRPGEYRIADFAADAAALLEDVLGEPSVIVGQSLGGLVADHLAGSAHPKVKAVYLVDPPLFILDQPVFDKTVYATLFPLLQAALRALREQDADLEGYRNLLRSAQAPSGKTFWDELGARRAERTALSLSKFDPEVFTQVLDFSASEGFDPHAPIRVPIHVDRGGLEDAAFRAEDEDVLRKSTPQVTFHHAKGLGHNLHAEDPESFAARLRAVLGRVE